MDFMQRMPCMHAQGGTIAGSYVTLTALPFKDHLNFAVGEAIQEEQNRVHQQDQRLLEQLGKGGDNQDEDVRQGADDVDADDGDEEEYEYKKLEDDIIKYI